MTTGPGAGPLSEPPPAQAAPAARSYPDRPSGSWRGGTSGPAPDQVPADEALEPAPGHAAEQEAADRAHVDGPDQSPPAAAGAAAANPVPAGGPVLSDDRAPHTGARPWPEPAAPLEGELEGVLETVLEAVLRLDNRTEEFAGLLVELRTRDAAAVATPVPALAADLAELLRLRRRDVELADRLHADVTRLRLGEVAAATAPLVLAMLTLHDQMVRLGALENPDSDAGLLRTQLLQALELTTGIRPYAAEPGDRFDAARHSGARRVATDRADLEAAVAATTRLGFQRPDGSVLRAADVEVFRHVPPPAALEADPALPGEADAVQSAAPRQADPGQSAPRQADPRESDPESAP